MAPSEAPGRVAFLREAGMRLAASHGEEDTARAVAALVVPDIADWFALYAVGADGIRLVSVAHTDPAMRALAEEYVKRYPATLEDAGGVGAAVRTGKPWIRQGITEEQIRAAARDEDHLRLLSAIGPRAALCIPLTGRQGVVGGLILCHAASGRSFSPEDVALAEGLGHLAALALDNARLHRAELEALALLVAQNEASPDGIFFQGADGRSTFFNERLLKMWGVDESVPAGATVEERLAAVMHRFEDPEGFARLVLELEGRPDRTARLDVRVKGGQIFDCISAPVRAPGGTFLGRAWYYRDVTAQRATEAELALARRRLVETEKLALVGSLVAGVAHEIRTPLTYIGLHSAIVDRAVDRLRGRQDPEAGLLTESAAAIREGADRINRLVEELRRLARRAPEGIELVRFDDAARAGALLFEATHRGRIVLDATYGDPGRLRMRPVQLEQVVINLLENAADASQPGGRVRLLTRRTPRGEAVLVVEDEGVGIPPEVQARMYEPFFTTKPDGMGFGLSFVRRFVEEHRGTIRCESAPGRGTRFTLTLPPQPAGPQEAPVRGIGPAPEGAAAGGVPTPGARPAR